MWGPLAFPSLPGSWGLHLCFGCWVMLKQAQAKAMPALGLQGAGLLNHSFSWRFAWVWLNHLQRSRRTGHREWGSSAPWLGRGSVLAGTSCCSHWQGHEGLNYRERCGILQIFPRMWGDGAGLELLVPSTASRLVLLAGFGGDCQYLYLDFSGCQTNCEGLEELSSDDWSGCLSLEAMESSTYSPV